MITRRIVENSECMVENNDAAAKCRAKTLDALLCFSMLAKATK